MRVRFEGSDWQPGNIYPPDDGPRPMVYEGEIACGFHDRDFGDVFVIWDEKANVFRKAKINYCKKI